MSPAAPVGDPRNEPSATRGLARNAQLGDAPSFEALYARLAPALLAWVRLRMLAPLRAHMDEQDVMAEVWLRALKAFSAYDSGARRVPALVLPGREARAPGSPAQVELGRRAAGVAGRFRAAVRGARRDHDHLPPPGQGRSRGTAGRRMTGGVYLGSFPPGQLGSGFPVVPTLPFTSGTGIVTSPMPTSLSAVGFHFACQARSGTGVAGTVAPRLSCAVEGTIGMF